MPDQTTTDGYLLGLYYGDAATYAESTVFTEVTQVTECTPPSMSADKIETQHLKTPDRYKTSKAGWRDGGEVSATVQYTPDQYQTLAGKFGQTMGWKVVFADEDTTNDGGVGFSAWISKLETPSDGAALTTISLTLTVTGKPSVIQPETSAT